MSTENNTAILTVEAYNRWNAARKEGLEVKSDEELQVIVQKRIEASGLLDAYSAALGIDVIDLCDIIREARESEK